MFDCLPQDYKPNKQQRSSDQEEKHLRIFNVSLFMTHQTSCHLRITDELIGLRYGFKEQSKPIAKQAYIQASTYHFNAIFIWTVSNIKLYGTFAVFGWIHFKTILKFQIEVQCYIFATTNEVLVLLLLLLLQLYRIIITTGSCGSGRCKDDLTFLMDL